VDSGGFYVAASVLLSIEGSHCPARTYLAGGCEMHGLTGERVLMRIHLGERDKHHGKPLYEAIVYRGENPGSGEA